MTPEQFWSDDGTLFYAYEKAYITRLHQESHIQGLYTYRALEVALSNAFAEKGKKKEEYPKTPIFSPYSEENIKQKQLKNMSSKERDNVLINKMMSWKVGGNSNGRFK